MKIMPLFPFRKQFRFRYEASGYGDADITIEYGIERVVFHATYVGANPLRDFLELLPDLISGHEHRGYMRWRGEPGELRVSIEVNGKSTSILIEEYGDPYDLNTKDETKWIKKLEASLPLEEIVKVVVLEAERNLRIHGIVGLADAWERETEVFPVAAYLKLKGVSSIVVGDDNYVSDFSRERKLLYQL